MLRPKKKITKRDIKRDPLLEALYSAQKFLERNRIRLLALLGVVLVSIIVILVGSAWNRSDQRAASELLARGQVSYDGGDYSGAVDDFDLLIAEYPRSREASEALFHMGKAHLSIDNFGEAERLLRKYGEKGKSESLLTASVQILAGIAESEERYAEAARLFQRASSMAEFPFEAQQNEINAAANWVRSGDLEKASTILDRLEGLDSPHRLIEEQVDELSSRLKVASLRPG
ncbi:MAG: tetratricopeptide repeat protein [Candidatus Neomarinimicrobiota bacterium]